MTQTEAQRLAALPPAQQKEIVAALTRRVTAAWAKRVAA